MFKKPSLLVGHARDYQGLHDELNNNSVVPDLPGQIEKLRVAKYDNSLDDAEKDHIRQEVADHLAHHFQQAANDMAAKHTLDANGIPDANHPMPRAVLGPNVSHKDAQMRHVKDFLDNPHDPQVAAPRVKGGGHLSFSNGKIALSHDGDNIHDPTNPAPTNCVTCSSVLKGKPISVSPGGFGRTSWAKSPPPPPPVP